MHETTWDDHFGGCSACRGHSGGEPASGLVCDFCRKSAPTLKQIGRGPKAKHICRNCEQLRRPGSARDPRTDPRLAAVRPDPRVNLPVRKFGHRG